MLILAWLAAFTLCQICLLDLRLWWAGLIVAAIVAIASKAYRGGRDEILMTICYVLMWPFFSPHAWSPEATATAESTNNQAGRIETI